MNGSPEPVSDAQHPSRWRATGPAAAFLAAATVVVVYWNGLDGPMVLDDAKEIGALVRAAEQGYRWRAGDLISSSGLLGRPVSRLSFMLDALAGHELRLWKLGNLLLHLACGLLLFLAGRRILGRFAGSERATTLAALLAVVWLLHPLQVSTVLYTVQRMTLLSALFTLGGILAYLVARERQLAGKAGGWRFFALALTALPLAVLSKENGALLPFYLLLFELFLPDLRWRRGGRGLLLFHGLLLLPFAVGAPFLLEQLFERSLPAYAVRPFTLGERLLTESRVMFHYLYMILLPVPDALGFVHDDIAVSRGLLRPPTTLLALSGLAALVALAVLQYRRRPLLGLGIAFFLLGHSMEGTIFPLELAFEHRNYLPMYGVFLALAGSLPLRAARLWRWMALPALVVPALLAWRTAERVGHWADLRTLVAHIHQMHPRSERINSYLARSLAAEGRYREALALLDPAGSPGMVIQRLATECRAAGRLDPKRLQAITLHPEGRLDIYGAMELMDLIGDVLDGKCLLPKQEMLAVVEKLLDAFPMYPDDRYGLLMYKAHLLEALGRRAAALSVLDEAAGFQGGFPVPLYLATEWLARWGETDRARKYLERARAVARHRREDFSELDESASGKLREALDEAGDDS